MQNIYSVIALLDTESRTYLSTIMRCLPTTGLIGEHIEPHITIAVYEKNPDTAGLIAWTEQVAARQKAFKLRYDLIGIFLSGSLVAVPSFSSELWQLYSNHHERFGDYCRDWGIHKSDVWLPHTGLCYTDRESAKAMMPKLADLFEPFVAEVVALRISEYDGKDFNAVAEFALKSYT